MARLGPWDDARRIAVAVSGGPDSLALALLAQRWGRPEAFIVDHGLRSNSAAEGEGARAALVARGIPARVLTLAGLHPGPGLASRARHARYAALAAACRAAGLVDLLLGHHAGDQAETVLMRRRRGSGPAGLAGMAALVTMGDIRLLRPLLDALPEQLRAVVDDAGLTAAEDPGNTDPRHTRARLRREIGQDRAALLTQATTAGRARAAAETAAAAELATRACLYPEGYAVLSPGRIGAATFSALLRSVSGRDYPVDAARLAAGLKPATLAGVRVLPAGRAGEGWLLTREPGAMQPAIPAEPGAVWDGRFRMGAGAGGGWIGAVGHDACKLRRLSGLPSAVLQTLPALRYNAELSAVPHLGYCARMVEIGVPVRNACSPAAGLAFLVA